MPRNHPWSLRLLADQEDRRYRYEQISLALSGWLLGYWQQFDVIHFCDLSFGSVLHRLRQVFKYEYKLLFANYGGFEPAQYQHIDHIQEFSPDLLLKAKQSIRKTRLALNPVGIWPERYKTEQSQAELREEWGIPQGRFVILSMAPLDEPDQRLAFLIDTVAALNDGNIYLLLAGQNRGTPQAREFLTIAEAKLAGRFQHLSVPQARVAEIYQAADLLIQPSLQESFSRIYLEAMVSRLPLLCHDCPNTQWMIKTAESLVDMENSTALQAAIRRMQDEAGTGRSEFAQNLAADNHDWAVERYHWQKLRREYMEMYERVLFLPA